MQGKKTHRERWKIADAIFLSITNGIAQWRTFVVCIFHFQHAHAFCWHCCCSSSSNSSPFYKNGFLVFISLCFIIHLLTTSQQQWQKKRRLFMVASDSLCDKFFPNFSFVFGHLMRFQLDLFRFGDFLISFFTKYFRLSFNEFTTIYSLSHTFPPLNIFFFVKFHLGSLFFPYNIAWYTKAWFNRG